MVIFYSLGIGNHKLLYDSYKNKTYWNNNMSVYYNIDVNNSLSSKNSSIQKILKIEYQFLSIS